MRWLTLLLIVVNLGVFGYFQQQEQTARLQDSYTNKLPAVPAWQLLAESASVELVAEAGEDVAAVQGVTPPQPVESSPAETVTGSTGVYEDEAPSCYRWGEFDRRREAEAVLTQLQPLESRIEARPVPLRPEYWVYIPAPPTATERNQLSRYLSDMGLDNYWIQGGRLKGELSMGLYRNQGSAEALRSLLQDRGFAAEIYLKPRHFNRYSIDFMTGLSASEVAAIAAAVTKKSPQLKTEKKVCQGVASADQPE